MNHTLSCSVNPISDRSLLEKFSETSPVLIKTDGISVDVIRLKVVDGIPSDRRLERKNSVTRPMRPAMRPLVDGIIA